jgi:hypothetical protein
VDSLGQLVRKQKYLSRSGTDLDQIRTKILQGKLKLKEENMTIDGKFLHHTQDIQNDDAISIHGKKNFRNSFSRFSTSSDFIRIHFCNAF